jgi:hypothetical protein
LIFFILASYNRSLSQPNSAKTLITEVKSTPSASSQNLSLKKIPTQSRSNKSPSTTTTKGNKFKKNVGKTIETTKRSKSEKKPHQTKTSIPMIFTSTGLSSKPIDKISTPPTKTAKKSVTNAVISYLHYRGVNGGYTTGRDR